MLLRGAFLFQVDSQLPIHTFEIRHPQMNGLVQSRITIRRFRSGRYIYSSQMSLLMEPSVTNFRATKLGGSDLWLVAVQTLLRRPSWNRIRFFIKAIVRRNPTALEDLLEAAWMVGIETNDGRQDGEEIVFRDGFRCQLVTRTEKFAEFSRRKLVLFPHFEPHPGVSLQDVTTLRYLHGAGYDTIVLSTSLGDEGIKQLGFVNAVVVRPNVGHDFFSWKVGFSLFGHEIRRAKHLLLLNNSVFISGPRTLLELDGLPDGFGCLHDGRLSNSYAESYCLLFKNLGPSLPLLFEFFDGVVVHQAKQRVIQEYEIGLTRFLANHGLEVHAVYPYKDLLSKAFSRSSEYPGLAALLRKDPNQSACTTFYELLRDEGVSILKKKVQ